MAKATLLHDGFFKIPANLNVTNDASIVFIGGANPRNLYWAVGASAVIGTNATFAGNILALTSISLNTGAKSHMRSGLGTKRCRDVATKHHHSLRDERGGRRRYGDIPIDELGGEGVTGMEQTAFDASRLFGATMLAQTVFPNLAVGGPGFGSPGTGPQGNGPEKYTPLKLGPSPVPVGGDFYQPQRWRMWAAGRWQ